MVYLSGAVRPEILGFATNRYDLGVLLTPNMGNRPKLQGVLWAADNGLFAGPDKPVRPFGECEFARFKTLLERAGWDLDGCLFAVVPDAPFNAQGTLERWAEWYPRFRAELPAGVPLAFVAADGMTVDDVPWDELDVLFLGGSDAFKEGAAIELCAEARRRGKWVHMGRVNSRRRMAIAWRFRCDSADGTFIAFGPNQNLPKVNAWLGELNGQPVTRFVRGNLAWTRVPGRGCRLDVVAAHTVFGAFVGGWYACPQTPGNRFSNRGERRCIHCAAALASSLNVDGEGAWMILPCPCELCYETAFGAPAAAPHRILELPARLPAAA